MTIHARDGLSSRWEAPVHRTGIAREESNASTISVVLRMLFAPATQHVQLVVSMLVHARQWYIFRLSELIPMFSTQPTAIPSMSVKFYLPKHQDRHVSMTLAVREVLDALGVNVGI